MERTDNSVEHEGGLVWAEAEFEDVPPGFKVAIKGDALVAVGVCPRCAGKTRWIFRCGQMGAVSEGLAALSEDDLATIVCACGFVHKDRPDDAGESGCGAFWPISLKLT